MQVEKYMKEYEKMVIVEVLIIMCMNDRYEESEKIIKNKERGFIIKQMESDMKDVRK